MSAIREEFRGKSLLPGRTVILHPADAIEMVRQCRDKAVPVYGVDGFYLFPNEGVQPSMENSIDLSDASQNLHVRDNCWNRAEEFLEQYRARDLAFEVVVPL